MRRAPTFIVLLAIVVFGSAAAGAQDVQAPGGLFFDDNETVHEANIEAIAAVSITLGCVVEGTAYCPQREVTRAQMATFLARALHLDPRLWRGCPIALLLLLAAPGSGGAATPAMSTRLRQHSTSSAPK